MPCSHLTAETRLARVQQQKGSTSKVLTPPTSQLQPKQQIRHIGSLDFDSRSIDFEDGAEVEDDLVAGKDDLDEGQNGDPFSPNKDDREAGTALLERESHDHIKQPPQVGSDTSSIYSLARSSSSEEDDVPSTNNYNHVEEDSQPRSDNAGHINPPSIFRSNSIRFSPRVRITSGIRAGPSRHLPTPRSQQIKVLTALPLSQSVDTVSTGISSLSASLRSQMSPGETWLFAGAGLGQKVRRPSSTSSLRPNEGTGWSDLPSPMTQKPRTRSGASNGNRRMSMTPLGHSEGYSQIAEASSSMASGSGTTKSILKKSSKDKTYGSTVQTVRNDYTSQKKNVSIFERIWVQIAKIWTRLSEFWFPSNDDEDWA